MAPTIIDSDVVQGETFLPRQIFVFGSFALWANSLGHLEQIESYVPGHQVRYGSLNYTADIRRDLIFDGFKPMTAVPGHHDEHDLDLSSGHSQEIAPGTVLALEPEWTASLSMIEGAIKPNDDDTEELSMKAPMSVSKLADLG